ncbi:MAG: transposase [Elusimicrobiota bacterium]|nr:transposase [Elusimicrobiota bacterium]
MKALKNIRLKSYSYKTNGYYFVTICTDHRKPFLADKIKFVVAQFIEPSCKNRPDKIGATTKPVPSCLINQATTNNVKEFLGMKGVYVDEYEIVPTHIHLIIILEDSAYSLSEVIRRFKAKTTLVVARFIWQKGFKLWQPNYGACPERSEGSI